MLTWGADPSNVDLHLLGATGRRATVDTRVNTLDGYGPDVMIVEGIDRAYPYTVHVFYESLWAMGDGRWAVQVLEYDGHGRVRPAGLRHDARRADART